MKTTIFTSNSLRHLSLINKIAKISNECNAIVEVKTLFPGQNKDFFIKSKIMGKYFIEVDKAEKKYFRKDNFVKDFVRTKMIKQGDLNSLNKEDLKFALNSDVYIIFGSSYITNNWLINFLIKKKQLIFIWVYLHFTEVHHVISGPCMMIIRVMLGQLFIIFQKD